MTIASVPRVDEIASFLAASSICRSLSPTEIAEVIFALQLRTAEPGAVIIQEGSLGDAWFLIFSGQCEVRREAQPLARLGPGEFFGELSVLDGAARSASVCALTAVTLLRCSASALEALLASGSLAAHKVVLAMTRELARRMRALLDEGGRAALEGACTAIDTSAGARG